MSARIGKVITLTDDRTGNNLTISSLTPEEAAALDERDMARIKLEFTTPGDHASRFGVRATAEDLDTLAAHIGAFLADLPTIEPSSELPTHPL